MKSRRCRSDLWHGSFAIFNTLIIKSVLRSIIDVCLCLTFHIGDLHYDWTAFLLWNTYSSSWSNVMSVNEVIVPRTPAFFALFLVLFTFSKLTSILRNVFCVAWSSLVDHDQVRDRRMERFFSTKWSRQKSFCISFLFLRVSGIAISSSFDTSHIDEINPFGSFQDTSYTSGIYWISISVAMMYVFGPQMFRFQWVGCVKYNS